MDNNLELVKEKIYELLENSEKELTARDLSQIGGLVLRIEQFEYEKEKEDIANRGGNNVDIAPIPPSP